MTSNSTISEKENRNRKIENKENIKTIIINY